MYNCPKLFVYMVMALLSSTAAASDIGATFEQLKSLTGYWTRQGETNGSFKIQFELTAKDTVLVETWWYKGDKHSLTVYHRDGEQLLATHYCPQGNQPRLRLKKLDLPGKIAFEFFDVTNLNNPDDSHQHSLEYRFSDDGSVVTRVESYLSGSGEKTSELVLERLARSAEKVIPVSR